MLELEPFDGVADPSLPLGAVTGVRWPSRSPEATYSITPTPANRSVPSAANARLATSP